MKAIKFLFLALGLFLVQAPSHAAVAIHGADTNHNLKAEQMSAFLDMTPASFEEATGRKMKFKERVALKMMKKKMKRMEARKDRAKTKGFQFHVGSFLLCLFLSLLGFLIAWLVWGFDDRDILLSSVIGLVASLALFGGIFGAL